MQISRMPIPADDCANSEMSVDTSPSDTKTDDLETTTKVNGDSHKKLNGTTVDNTIETDEASQLVIKKEEEENDEEDNEDEDDEEEKAEKEKDKKEKEPENKTEPLSKTTDKIMKNGVSEEQKSVETINGETSTTNDDPIINEDKDEEVKPMEIDEAEDQTNEDVVIKKETLEVEELEVTEDVETQETEKHINLIVNHKDEVITTSNKVLKNSEEVTNPMNGEVKLSEDNKHIKSEKVNRKVLEEEDMSSEISTDTLSPKQVFIKCKFH